MCDWDGGSGARSGKRWRTALWSRLDVTFMLVALLALSPVGFQAQTTEEYRVLVDQLRQEWHEANAAYQAFRERERSGPIDTIRVGTLTVLTQRDFGALVETGARTAWDSIRLLGSDTLLLLGKTLFVPGPGWLNRYDQEHHGATFVSSRLSLQSDEDGAAARILSAIMMLLLDGWKEELRSWLGGHFELQDASSTNLGWVHVELVTAPSQAVRACYLGDLEACGSALVLTEVDDPALKWYNADERRVVVERRLPGRYPGRGQLWVECVRERSDPACLEFLTAEADYEVPAPLSVGARRTLFGFAIELGGEGAYTRLLSAEASEREASLAAAASQTPDSLLAAWRSAVLSARPESPTLTLGGASAALFWIMVFLAAATRSTRWRLG